MPTITFANQPITPSQLLANNPDLLEPFCRINRLDAERPIATGNAYSLDLNHPQTGQIVSSFNLRQTTRDRTIQQHLVNAMGADVHVLAAFTDKYFSFDNLTKINSMVGAAATAADTRLDAFEKAMIRFQEALFNLRQLEQQHLKGRSANGQRLTAIRRVKEAYAALETRYTVELSKLTNLRYRNKNAGDALSNADRAITLAKRNASSPNIDTRLLVNDKLQANRLTSLTKLVRGLGNAAVVADAGLRVQKVNEMRTEGGDWMRESAKQITGFGTGGAAGILVGRATMTGGIYLAAEAGLLVAGPVGWAVLGSVLLVSFYAGYVAGNTGDITGKWVANKLWES